MKVTGSCLRYSLFKLLWGDFVLLASGRSLWLDEFGRFSVGYDWSRLANPAFVKKLLKTNAMMLLLSAGILVAQPNTLHCCSSRVAKRSKKEPKFPVHQRRNRRGTPYRKARSLSSQTDPPRLMSQGSLEGAIMAPSVEETPFSTMKRRRFRND